MTQNGISSFKIDFLSNSNKTFSIVYLKIMNSGQNLKKRKSTTLFFVKKMTQN